MFPEDNASPPHRSKARVLCIDNHASSTYSFFLLRRSGYHVESASFFCDAIDLIKKSAFDVYLINDELARAGKDMLQKFCELAGATPIVFYSTLVYPFSTRLADQSGATLDTPTSVTEAAIAVARALSHVPRKTITSTRAA